MLLSSLFVDFSSSQTRFFLRDYTVVPFSPQRKRYWSNISGSECFFSAFFLFPAVDVGESPFGSILKCAGTCLHYTFYLMNISIARLVPKIRFEKHTGTVCPPCRLTQSFCHQLNWNVQIDLKLWELRWWKTKNNRFWWSLGHEAADHQVLKIIETYCVENWAVAKQTLLKSLFDTTGPNREHSHKVFCLKSHMLGQNFRNGMVVECFISIWLTVCSEIKILRGF